MSSRPVIGLVPTAGALVSAAPIWHLANRPVFHPKVYSSAAGPALSPVNAATAAVAAAAAAAAAAASSAVAPTGYPPSAATPIAADLP